MAYIPASHIVGMRKRCCPKTAGSITDLPVIDTPPYSLKAFLPHAQAAPVHPYSEKMSLQLAAAFCHGQTPA
jgi:hypothetical protein